MVLLQRTRQKYMNGIASRSLYKQCCNASDVVNNLAHTKINNGDFSFGFASFL